MEIIGYYVSIIRASIIDANNLGKKNFVNNITNLLFHSVINFNLFLLKT